MAGLLIFIAGAAGGVLMSETWRGVLAWVQRRAIANELAFKARIAAAMATMRGDAAVATGPTAGVAK